MAPWTIPIELCFRVCVHVLGGVRVVVKRTAGGAAVAQAEAKAAGLAAAGTEAEEAAARAAVARVAA